MKRKRVLQLSFGVSTILLVGGLIFCILSLDQYAFGLYFILISIVGYIIGFSFCIVEPEDGHDKAIASKMWKSVAQRSFRRPRSIAVPNMAVQNRILAEHVKELVAGTAVAGNNGTFLDEEEEEPESSTSRLRYNGTVHQVMNGISCNFTQPNVPSVRNIPKRRNHLCHATVLASADDSCRDR